MPLKGKQYKLDVDGDKKITRKDFMILAKNSKKKKRMTKLTPKQIITLNKHSKHHSKKHMDMMKKLMREGKTFKAAHTAAQKEVGK